MSASDSIQQFLSTTRLATPQEGGVLTLTPILLRDDRAPCPVVYLPLEKAQRQGSVKIDEVSAGGSVAHVRVRNGSDVPVLFLFGEEIQGAKQNRVANGTFLIGGRSEVVIDVSCVEQGRWSRREGERFRGTSEVISQRMRQKMSARVADARVRGGRFDADQGEVWDEIDLRLQNSAAETETAAYDDYRHARREDLASLEQRFRCRRRQVGFVATIAGRIQGVEIVGRPEVFRAAFSGLLRAYTIDAVEVMHTFVDPLSSKRRDDDLAVFLESLVKAGVREGDSLGLGRDLRLRSDHVEGCALDHHGLVHLVAYPRRHES